MQHGVNWGDQCEAMRAWIGATPARTASLVIGNHTDSVLSMQPCCWDYDFHGVGLWKSKPFYSGIGEEEARALCIRFSFDN
jgi:hypothetical protein